VGSFGFFLSASFFFEGELQAARQQARTTLRNRRKIMRMGSFP